MPTNFTNSLETVSPPNMTGARPREDVSGNIMQAAQSLSDLGKAYEGVKEKKEKASAFSSFYDAVDDVDAAEAAYYARRNAYQMGLQSNDKSLVEKYSQAMLSLTNGEDQGVLTPVQAALQRSAIMKRWSASYPDLEKDFRAISNELSGNLSAAQKEQYGEDPFTRQAKKDIEDAVGSNRTVAQVRQDRHLKEQAELAQIERTALKSQADVKGDEVYRGLYNEFVADAKNLPNVVRGGIQEYLKANPNATLDDLKAQLGNLKQTYLNRAQAAIGEDQLHYGGVLASTQESTLVGIYENVFKNMEADINAANTKDNFLKKLELDNKIAVTGVTHTWIQNNKDNPYVILAENPLALAQLAEADLITQNKVSQLIRGGDTKSQALENIRRQLIAKNDIQGQAALDRYERGHSVFPITMGFNNISSGTAPNTGNVVDDLMSKQVAVAVFEGSNQQRKAELLPSIVQAFEWSDIMATPQIKAGLRSSPEARMIVVDKAAQEAVKYLGVPGTQTEMVLDWSNPVAPFQYKQVVEGGEADMLMYVPDPNVKSGLRSGLYTPQMQAIDKMNEIYRGVRDTLGLNETRNFLEAMTKYGITAIGSSGDSRYSMGSGGPEQRNRGTPRPQPTDDGSKKKSTVIEKYELVEPAAKVIEYNRYGIPDAFLLGLMEQESSLGKNMDDGDPTTSASGPMQIIRGTFEQTNQRYFGGTLRWGNEDDIVKASLAHLDELWKEHDGDIDRILYRWRGHKDQNVNIQYARQVKNRIRKYMNG